MTPFEFAKSYSTLRVADSKMGLNFTTRIWMYISSKTKGKERRSGEYNDVMSRIASHLKLAGPSVVSDTFYITGHSKFDPGEPFYKQGIRRAFAGRGSPDEIRDATRLAWGFKECAPFYDAARYCQGWFGQDCNAFAGNYLGISPNVSIAGYAKGYSITEEEREERDGIPGATVCVYVSQPFLPLPVVTDANRIKAGTVIITYGDGRFKHIALVNSFRLVSGTSGRKGIIEIAEWGEAGDLENHAKPPVEIDLDYSAKLAVMGEKKLIGFSKKAGDLRFFVDSSSLSLFGQRGWSVCGTEGY